MAEYIERERLKQWISEDALNALTSWDDSLMALVMTDIDECPTMDVAPVVHGRWETYSTTMMACSKCGKHTAKHRFNYCPSCGARMDEEEAHDKL